VESLELKAMKKTWSIINKKDGRVLIETPIQGTRKQAESFLMMKFDPEFTEVKEIRPIDLNEIEFEVDLSDTVHATSEGDILFSVRYYKGQFILTDEDGQALDEIHVEFLKQFPNFVPLVECENCEGKGFYMVQGECDFPSSMCCGGCEKPVQCNCESVRF
jgi:hypothetical protein